MSTIDQAQIRESSPAKDRRPHNSATPPTAYPVVNAEENVLLVFVANRRQIGDGSRQVAALLAAEHSAELDHTMQVQIVNYTRTANGIRSFSTAAPLTWNSLPPAVLKCDLLTTFKSTLKTHPFSTAFC